MENKYHPDIQSLETTEIDITFTKEKNGYISGHNSKFYVVPTEMIINRHIEYELWKGCPSLINWDMLKCIDEIEASGKYPYNSTVGELFCSKYGIEKYIEHSFLSAMVYCTQSYKSSVRDEQNAKELDIKLKNNGYIQATNEILSEAFKNNIKYYVMLKGSNFLGDEVLTKKEKPMRLIEHNGNYIWMPPNATRRGYMAQKGQYIKLK